MNQFSRRDFLKVANRFLLAVSGFLGIGALGRFWGYRSETNAPREFDLGLADAYPLGSRTLLESVPAVLVHDKAGFSALSLTCTHLGCTLEEEETRLSCPCHGSVFNVQGQVVQGPAEENLAELEVELRSDGHLVLRL